MKEDNCRSWIMRRTRLSSALCPRILSVLLVVLAMYSCDSNLLCAMGVASECFEEQEEEEKSGYVSVASCTDDSDCASDKTCVCWGEDCQCLKLIANVDCVTTDDCYPGYRCQHTDNSFGPLGTCVPGQKGETCYWGTCGPGLVCVAKSVQSAKGECGTPGLGSECVHDASCPEWLACALMFSEGKKACVETAAEGEPCALDQFLACAEGLGCNTLSTPAVCGPAGSRGIACFSDDGCKVGLICAATYQACMTGQDYSPCQQDGDCSSAGTTHHCVQSLGVCSSFLDGSACVDVCQEPLMCVTGSLPLEWPICQGGGAGSYCDTSDNCQGEMTCVETAEGHQCGGALSEGEDCSTAVPGFAECADGLICNLAYSPAICALPGANGSPCTKDSHCVSKGTCILGFFGTGLCTDGLLGSPCVEDQQCHNGFMCGPGTHTCSTGDLGAGCALHDDCRDGLYCAPDAHVCTQNGSGTACTTDSHCPEDYFCVAQSECHNGDEDDLCVAPEQCQDPLFCNSFDSSCHYGDVSDPCGVPEDCQEPLICVESENTCSIGAVGDWCDAPEDCLEGAWCVESVGTCHGGTNGEPCDSQDQCQLNQWCIESILECHNGTKGEPCGSDDDCLPFLWCVQSVGQCQDGSPGAPCEAHSQCQQGTDCGGNPAICLSGFELWPCTEDNDCQPDFSCVEKGEGLCYDGSIADPCSDHDDCGTDLFCATALPNPICIPTGDEGVACLVDEECNSGHYCFPPLLTCYDGSNGDPCTSDQQCEEDFCDEGECW